MARKTLEVVITEENRDKGKKFFIEEPDCVTAETLCARVLHMTLSDEDASEGGIKLSGPDLIQRGLGIIAISPFDMLKPIYDELLSYCYFCPDGNVSVRMKLDQSTALGCVEEVSTLMMLRWRSFKLITGFFMEGGVST